MSPRRLPQPRPHLACWRLVLIVAGVAPLCACNSPSAAFDCSGDGEVRGSFSEINSGELTFRHGLIVGDAGRGYTVLFTDDDLLAKALRASPEPEAEVGAIAQMLGKLVVGYEFDVAGNYQQRITRGTSSGSGMTGSDEGRVTIDDQGCARGDVTLTSYGSGFFALPLQRDRRRREVEGNSMGESASGEADDPLATWADAFARLIDLHPVIPLETLGFSTPAATQLSSDPRAQAALKRVREQCPDPRTATVNEYGEVVGPSTPGHGARFNGTVQVSRGPDGPVLGHCYVMQRDDAYIEQCFPLHTDCAKVPLWDPKS